MADQPKIAVQTPAPNQTSQVLAVAGALALEWAAPFAQITVGGDAEFIVQPHVECIGGLFRLDAERKARLLDAGIQATHEEASARNIVEAADGSWNLASATDPWSSAGLAIGAASFSASSPAGKRLAEALVITEPDSPDAVDLLEQSQSWALREIEKIVAEMGKQQPRRLLNLLLEAVATAENLADSYSILRARYKRDIEIMSENQ